MNQSTNVNIPLIERFAAQVIIYTPDDVLDPVRAYGEYVAAGQEAPRKIVVACYGAIFKIEHDPMHAYRNYLKTDKQKRAFEDHFALAVYLAS